MENSKTKNEGKWDFFIAYAHKDKEVALKLFNSILENNCTAFIDQTSIELGTYWDQEIPKVQQQSLVTIALISGNIREAHYARDEIHTAISLARANPDFHKVIPVYLEDSLEESLDIIYGLRLIQGIELSSIGSIEKLGNLLCSNIKNFTSSIDTTTVKSSQHILLSYPTGPLVEPHDIPRIIIEMYAKLIKESEARLVVNEVNAFRREANPETQFIIPLHKIPAPERISAFNFWIEVFNYASLQGPRMMAALLITIPDDQFEAKAKNVRNKLLEKLKNYSQ
jgi:hypothetical protein